MYEKSPQRKSEKSDKAIEQVHARRFLVARRCIADKA